jgi:hypothetical protein
VTAAPVPRALQPDLDDWRLANLADRVAEFARRGHAAPALRLWWRWSGQLFTFGAWGTYEVLDQAALVAARSFEHEPVARLVEGLVLAELGWLAMEYGDSATATARWAQAENMFAMLDDALNLARLRRYQAGLAYRKRRIRWLPWVRGVERPAHEALALLEDERRLQHSPMCHLRRDLERLVNAPLVDNLEEGGYSEDVGLLRVVHLAEVYNLLASLAARRLDWRAAWAFNTRADNVLPKPNGPGEVDRYAYWRVGLMHNRGRHHLREVHIAEAEAEFEASIALARALPAARAKPRRDMVAAGLLGLAACSEQRGDFRRAAELALGAREIYVELGTYDTVDYASAVIHRVQRRQRMGVHRLDQLVEPRSRDTTELIELQVRWALHYFRQGSVRDAALATIAAARNTLGCLRPPDFIRRWARGR